MDEESGTHSTKKLKNTCQPNAPTLSSSATQNTTFRAGDRRESGIWASGGASARSRREASSSEAGGPRALEGGRSQAGRGTAARESASGQRRVRAPSSPGSPSCDESRPPRCAVRAPARSQHRPARPSPWAAAAVPHHDFNRQGRQAGRPSGLQEDRERRISDVSEGAA